MLLIRYKLIIIKLYGAAICRHSLYMLVTDLHFAIWEEKQRINKGIALSLVLNEMKKGTYLMTYVI